MNSRERGFLLLSSHLGDPNRRPLTTAQMRILADRAWQMDPGDPERDLVAQDLIAVGYGMQEAERILALLAQEDLLEYYLTAGRRAGCVPIARVSEAYPLILRKRLGLDSPGVLWSKGNAALLKTPMIALVGSRELSAENREFACMAGRQAALQGYTLVSGNARGADKAAQNACLEAGGSVVCVVADSLTDKPETENVLWLSEDGFAEAFSSQRALSRNRCIHALGIKTLVAQCGLGMGGTWDGTVKNLRGGWSDVFCFQDGSESVKMLAQMGAEEIGLDALENLDALRSRYANLFGEI